MLRTMRSAWAIVLRPGAGTNAFALPSRPLSSLSDFGNVHGATEATDETLAVFHAWHESIRVELAGGSAADVMRPHVAVDCVFKPPTYFKPWKGAEEVMLILGTAGHVLGGPDGTNFSYGRQWLSDDGRHWALEFAANDIGGKVP